MSSGKGALALSIVLGVATSVIASYVYQELSTRDVGLTTFVVISVACALAYFGITMASPAVNLALRSPFVGYYPRGQEQYMRRLLRDMKKSTTVTLVGSRGLDLVGSNSEIAKALNSWTGEVRAFLIRPDSHHARLRSGALDIERAKYQAEVQGVVASLQLMSLQAHSSIELFVYDNEPRIRAIVLDRFSYLSLYQENVQGRNLPAVRIRNDRGPGRMAIEAYLKSLSADRVRMLTAVELNQITQQKLEDQDAGSSSPQEPDHE